MTTIRPRQSFFRRRTPPAGATVLVLTSLLLVSVTAANGRRAFYNSEEHRLIVDRGIAQVVIPAGVQFPTGIAMTPIAPQAYADAIANAKRLAVGFGTNNAAEYSDQAGKVQDNCYWTGFGQIAYNKAIYVPSPDRAPDKILSVHGYTTANQAGGFTIGQLAALYGDYRRTTWCDGSGKCYLTNTDVGEVGFSRGNVARKGTFCPDNMLSGRYLQAVASGVVPPFGSLGNTTSNTANDDEYGDAGWWGDEMLRIANVNDWHFTSAAIAWYVGLHRLALLYADSARTDSKHWVRALHYEANALHSLTDLFAFGHVVTNRDETTYGIMKDQGLVTNAAYLWMENVIKMGGGVRSGTGKVAPTAILPAIKDVAGARNEFVKSYRGTWVSRADDERRYHDEFNKTGAQVRNLNGDEFYIMGDKGLNQMFTTGSSVAVLQNAVKTSVQSLIDAHVALKGGGSVPTIGQAGSTYFAALKFIPVYISRDANGYFPGYWTIYASAVNGITGVNKALTNWDKCQVPYLSGKDGVLWPSKPGAACASF